jgi:hypothetical protein
LSLRNGCTRPRSRFRENSTSEPTLTWIVGIHVVKQITCMRSLLPTQVSTQKAPFRPTVLSKCQGETHRTKLSTRLPEGGVSGRNQRSIVSLHPKHMGCWRLHDWRLVSPECRRAANAGHATSSLGRLMRTVPGKQASSSAHEPGSRS